MNQEQIPRRRVVNLFISPSQKEVYEDFSRMFYTIADFKKWGVLSSQAKELLSKNLDFWEQVLYTQLSKYDTPPDYVSKWVNDGLHTIKKMREELQGDPNSTNLDSSAKYLRECVLNLF